VEPEWVEVDRKRGRVEGSREFGGPGLGRELLRRLERDRFLEETLPNGREEIPWPAMAMILILGRLWEPSRERPLAEHLYEASAWSGRLGVADEKVHEDRRDRALDTLLPHKKALEKLRQERLGERFDLDYDLLLYDIASTDFEGPAEGNPQAQRGYSRDHRPDGKPVKIALGVSRCGMPLGYEGFAGNRHDATTLEERVAHREELYGRAGRVWIMDRGLASEKNVRFLRAGGGRSILGTAKNSLRKFERERRSEDWKQGQEGLEVRLFRPRTERKC
jgi:Transposase DDE domain